MLKKSAKAEELPAAPGGAATVKRYWPGRAPHWVKNDEQEGLSGSDEEAEVDRTAVAPPVILRRADDPRLQRLATTAVDDSDDDEEPAHRRASRRHEEEDTGQQAAGEYQAGAVEGDVEDDSDESDEDEELIEARRAAVKARLQLQRQTEPVPEALEEAEEEDEESSEYETDSEDEQYGRQLLKPVFVSKSERETIAERERLEKEVELETQRHQLRLEERKKETKEIVLDRIRLEEATVRNAEAARREEGDINTDDELEEEREYETWKSREMNRIRRERDEREREVRAAEEREMLKNMTDEERRAWEREHPKDASTAPKKSWKFMQKYWHKGAFFQSGTDNVVGEGGADEIFGRDYSAPTGEDRMDKTILPKVMQVKNFGRRGRTKWTHLVDQDTTEWDSPLAPDQALRLKFQAKMAGTQQVFEKPKQLKK